MKSNFTAKPTRLAAASFLAPGVFAATASAQIPSDEKALVVDSRGAPAQYVAPAPMPVWEKVAFDANVLFYSDGSELRAAGRYGLDAERIVKAYLVGKGIASERVQTSARGETRPSTYAGECKDAKNTLNVVCMQPDRHVFIEVSGSRVAK